MALLRCCSLLAIGTIAFASVAAHADDVEGVPQQSKHQMMKECMAKQKASDGGMPKEDMKRNCKDVTETERENEKTEKKDAAGGQAATQPPG